MSFSIFSMILLSLILAFFIGLIIEKSPETSFLLAIYLATSLIITFIFIENVSANNLKIKHNNEYISITITEEDKKLLSQRYNLRVIDSLDNYINIIKSDTLK